MTAGGRAGRAGLAASFAAGCALAAAASAAPALTQSQPAHLDLLAARPAADRLARLDSAAFSAVPARSWPARTWPIFAGTVLAAPITASAPLRAPEPDAADAPGLAEASGEPTPELVRLAPGAHRPVLRILQLGDSHTAADFLTGELRDRLQARYGDGGLGLMVAGLPTPGVRSSRLKITASPGWSYESIQKSAAPERFGLPGFLAEARKPGETLGFAAEAPVPVTAIELEVQEGPDEGAIEAEVDGRRTRYALQADAPRHVVLRLEAAKAQAPLRQLTLRTLDARHVAVLGLTLLNERGGASVSNIGFPGATVDILNRFPPQTVIAALRRLAPGMVILSFGTNEGFNDKLDLARYEEQYGRAIALIRAGAPAARIVMVGASDAQRVPAACIKEPAGKACEALRPVKAEAAKPELGKPPAPPECEWPTPPQLAAVRDWQRAYAGAHDLPFFDWSSLMPRHCGAQLWAAAEPKLMTADRVHFTREGYRRSALALARFIDPVVRQIMRQEPGGSHAVSND